MGGRSAGTGSPGHRVKAGQAGSTGRGFRDEVLAPPTPLTARSAGSPRRPRRRGNELASRPVPAAIGWNCSRRLRKAEAEAARGAGAAAAAVSGNFAPLYLKRRRRRRQLPPPAVRAVPAAQHRTASQPPRAGSAGSPPTLPWPWWASTWARRAATSRWPAPAASRRSPTSSATDAPRERASAAAGPGRMGLGAAARGPQLPGGSSTSPYSGGCSGPSGSSAGGGSGPGHRCVSARLLRPRVKRPGAELLLARRPGSRFLSPLLGLWAGREGRRQACSKRWSQVPGQLPLGRCAFSSHQANLDGML